MLDISKKEAHYMQLNGILPWTKSCFVCGEENPRGFRLRLQIENDRVFLQYKTRPSDVGYREIVHGGVLSTLLDETMAWAAIVSSGKLCVAAEITLRIRKPVRVNQLIRVEGWATKAVPRLVITQGIIRDTEGRELLHASGKYLPMPMDHAETSEDDFVIAQESIDPKLILKNSEIR